jgi:polyhydroxyalkanoate synthase
MLSWKNPGEEDRDLGMDDYLQLGVFDAALDAIARHRAGAPVHAMGYCLGGTLLAIAAARWRATATTSLAGELTLLAAQTDFSEPGELGLFIDEGQVSLLGAHGRGAGLPHGRRWPAPSSCCARATWCGRATMREYLMGERDR